MKAPPLVFLTLTLTLTLTVFVPMGALAAPVSIGDHSFEGSLLGGQTWSNDLSPEWMETGGPSADQGFEEFISGFSADGQNHLGMAESHTVWQDLGATYQSNTRYSLTVAVGHRSGLTNPGNESTFSLGDPAGTIYSSGNLDASSLPEGSFSDPAALVFETPNLPAAIGREIRIILHAGGSGRSHFDNIRLDSQILAAPEPPTVVVTAATNVSGASATLNGNVTDDGNESPSVTVYYGTADAGSSPVGWQGSTSIGTHSAAFATSVSGLQPETTYYFRVVASNSAGSAWSPTAASFATPAFAPGNLVINEIHYNDDDNTAFNEFVELHNNSDLTIDAAGYQLDGGVRFVVPGGVSVPARGYLVIAEVPANVGGAIGPYVGRLSGSGERLSLLDPTGAEIDRVDYSTGFPWPSRADGGGSSMELINPDLDNDLGSSWRSSATGFSGSPATFVTAGDTWFYRKGTSEASAPTSAWRQTNFIQDDSWLSGAASFGFNDSDDTTQLDDMQGNYSSVFMRKQFTVTGDVPTTLTLRLYYDDGAIVYINGTEVARTVSVDSGELNFRGNQVGDPSTDHGLAVRGHEALTDDNPRVPIWDTFNLSGTASYLVPGQNVVAVHALNETLGSSDLSIDLELKATPAPVAPADPTPGNPNATFTASPPPNIRQVSHTPQQPTAADPVTISAKVTDPDGVASVSLEIQTVDPGSYIRASDPAYTDPTNWTATPMTDPDGDDTFTATVPASTQLHRRLVRYRITVTDSLGSATTAPFTDDDSRNFAYFAYDGIPAWTGANQPGADGAVTFPAGLMDDIATYHVIANSSDVTRSQGGNRARYAAAFVYEGIVYDHVEFNVRGEASTTQSGKNKWRFHFNRGRNLEARDNYGKKYASSWDELNLNANASPWAPMNRGMAGLDEAVSFRLYELLGVPSPRTHYLQLRVIDAANEAPTSGNNGQYQGDLWGLWLAVEHPDGSFLDDRGLPDGNVYKQQGSGEKKHQGALHSANNADWAFFNNRSARTQTTGWWRDHMHMPTYYSFRAANRITGNVDIRDNYNSYVYHSTDGPNAPDGRWYVMPWDLDMMYVAETHWAGVLRQENSIMDNPELMIEFRNHCRELLDLVCADPTRNGGQIGQLVHEYADIVNPPGQELTWADIDQFMWNYHPSTKGNPNSHSGQGNHKGNFYYSPFQDSRIGGGWTRTLTPADPADAVPGNVKNHEHFVNYAISYMTDTDTDGRFSVGDGDQDGYGYNYLELESSEPRGSTQTPPDRPTITYTGTAGFPANGLSFQASTFSDTTGSFAAIQWRIGELYAPGIPGYIEGEPRIYEIEDNYTSPQLAANDPNHIPPASAVRPGHTYRARVRYLDTTGRASRWSEAVEFVAAEPDVSLLQQNLVVSEIMYHPASSPEAEYIELHNLSSSRSLDLDDVRFTKGIDFDFPAGTALAPGAYLLVARNTAVFESTYGDSLPLVGQYSNAIDNAGENLKLALGTTAIHEFVFDDKSPWPTSPDGSGTSLTLVSTAETPGPETPDDPLGHGDPLNWRASVAVGGSPGRSDSLPPFVGDPAADADSDGLSALLEHALGSSESSADPSPLSVTLSGGDLILTFPRRSGADDVSLLPEISIDLVNWTTEGIGFLSDTPGADGITTLSYRAGQVAPGSPRLYSRLRASQP